MDISESGIRARMVVSMTAALAASLFASAGANAASYTFDVLYSGGGSAALAPGSDDPLATTMNAGDSFTYSLMATGSGEWKTISSGSIFPLFALDLNESGTRVGDFTLNLEQNGVPVFTYSETGASNSFVHLGTNTVSIPDGLTFNQWVLTDTIVSADTTSTPISLLPWPGRAPEAYSPSIITYTTGVPEASSWAMMLLGFAGLGVAGYRKAKVAGLSSI